MTSFFCPQEVKFGCNFFQSAFFDSFLAVKGLNKQGYIFTRKNRQEFIDVINQTICMATTTSCRVVDWYMIPFPRAWLLSKSQVPTGSRHSTISSQARFGTSPLIFFL